MTSLANVISCAVIAVAGCTETTGGPTDTVSHRDANSPRDGAVPGFVLDSGSKRPDGQLDGEACAKIMEPCRTVADCCPYTGNRGELVCDQTGLCGIFHL